MHPMAALKQQHVPRLCPASQYVQQLLLALKVHGIPLRKSAGNRAQHRFFRQGTIGQKQIRLIDRHPSNPVVLGAGMVAQLQHIAQHRNALKVVAGTSVDSGPAL